jgi:hypothetical protein
MFGRDVPASRGKPHVRPVSCALLVAVAAGFAATANASQLVDRNAGGTTLAIDSKGEALITYRSAGNVKRVLAWGAVNAIAPTRARPQLAFKLDYAGGYGKYRTDYWKTFKGSCGAYDGPALAWKVAACKASDGSYWALQAWRRALPNYGIAPSLEQSASELRLSHWTGALSVLTISTDWAWRRWDHLFGTYEYDGSPVFGYKATAAGNPLDTFGRNVYVDTFDSAYGTGWKRENSFLTHAGTGVFCYSFDPHGARPAGKGVKYRATVEGPGVTPDVMWQGSSPGTYDKAADLLANDEIRKLGDRTCRAN